MYKHKLTLSTEALRKGGKPASTLFAERERERESCLIPTLLKRACALLKTYIHFTDRSLVY